MLRFVSSSWLVLFVLVLNDRILGIHGLIIIIIPIPILILIRSLVSSLLPR